MKIPQWLKAIAVLGGLFGVGAFFGLNRFDYIVLGVYLFGGLMYFGVCGLFWMGAYMNDIGKLGYYTLSILTLPYFLTVKVLEKTGGLEYLGNLINGKARDMGLPDSDTLMDMKEIDNQ